MKQEYKKLPDAEFEVMRQIWEMEPPITAPLLMDQMQKKDWKMQTLISLLIRLTERGFLRTEKKGRDRLYWPLIEKEDYLSFETKNFLKKHHSNSVKSFLSALYDGDKKNKEEIKELEEFLKDWGKETN